MCGKCVQLPVSVSKLPLGNEDDYVAVSVVDTLVKYNVIPQINTVNYDRDVSFDARR